MAAKHIMDLICLYAPFAALVVLLQQTLIDQGCPYRFSTVFAYTVVFRYYRTILQGIVWYTLPIINSIQQKSKMRALRHYAEDLARNVTVILTSLGPYTTDSFAECVLKLVANRPKRVVMSVGFAVDKPVCLAGLILMGLELTPNAPDDGILNGVPFRVDVCGTANRRKQVLSAVNSANDEKNEQIFVITDDHVYVPINYLDLLMEPFVASHKVGFAGSAFSVRRRPTSTWLDAFFNVLACLYLVRYTFNTITPYLIDGAASHNSGRATAIRAKIIQDPAFQHHFVNEYCFFGLVGPLHPDDDNCIARWNFRHGWDIAIVTDPAATVETDLGEYPKFIQQCLRWSRTTWRTNSCSLFTDRTVWFTQPFCVYAVHIMSFFNFALFYDSLMVFLLRAAMEGTEHCDAVVWALIVWIFLSKLVKTAGWWASNPRDLVFLPAAIAFGYFHSLLKLWTLLTFWDASWSGRKNVE